MLRAFYSLALGVVLGLSTTLWLRPGYAQELVASASRMRGQSPDQSGYSHASDAFSNVPYDGAPRPPVQPVPVTRPVTWPGTAVDSYVSARDSTVVASTQAAPASGSLSPAPAYPFVPATPAPLAAPTPTPFQPPPLGAQPYVQTSQPAPPASTGPAAPASMSPLAPSDVSLGARYQPQSLAAPVTSGTAAPQAAGSQGATSPEAYRVATALPIRSTPAASQPAPSSTQSPAPDLGAANVQIFPSTPQDFTDGQIVARIGTQVVLAGDVRTLVADWVAKKKIEVPKEQEEEFYSRASRELLKQIIETKLVYNDAMHTIPAANISKLEGNVNEVFDETELPKMLKANEVSSRQELEARLRQRGSSLDRERRNFFERSVSQNWLGEKINVKEVVPHAEILAHYQQHVADYEFPAKARWEELTVRFDRFPDKPAAYAAAAEMGNEIMRGTQFADVARARSHGPTASQGGIYDWTSKGSLVAKQLDEAIFSLPAGSLSQILESEQGFHIVRVLERKEAGRTPFTEVQGEIRKKLKEQKLKSQIDAYLGGLRKNTPVWTVYDDQPGGIDGLKEDDP